MGVRWSRKQSMSASHLFLLWAIVEMPDWHMAAAVCWCSTAIMVKVCQVCLQCINWQSIKSNCVSHCGCSATGLSIL
jgi:hypothetical protein